MQQPLQSRLRKQAIKPSLSRPVQRQVLRLQGAPGLSHQADFLSPAERSNAIHSVDLCCSQIVKIAIMIGSPIKAPAMPQRKLQKNTTNRTMNGDIDKAAPAIFGSR